jgi:hypothetical protein
MIETEIHMMIRIMLTPTFCGVPCWELPSDGAMPVGFELNSDWTKNPKIMMMMMIFCTKNGFAFAGEIN